MYGNFHSSWFHFCIYSVPDNATTSKIDGESVFESGYDAIVYKLKTSDRPVLVHFLGYAPAGKQAYNTDDGENTAE